MQTWNAAIAPDRGGDRKFVVSAQRISVKGCSRDVEIGRLQMAKVAQWRWSDSVRWATVSLVQCVHCRTNRRLVRIEYSHARASF
jgi:hypothetical protein